MDIACYDRNDKVIKKVYQWDINQEVRIAGLPDDLNLEFHFCSFNSDVVYNVQPKFEDSKYIAEIPNIILQEPEDIVVYVYKSEPPDSARTICSILIPLVARPRPDSYIYNDNVEYYITNQMIKPEAIYGDVLKAADANVLGGVCVDSKTDEQTDPVGIDPETHKLYVKHNEGINVTGAAVGQIVEVSEVDADGKPTKWTPVNKPQGVQSDWNQNDATQPDYVKNRPFYEDVQESVTFDGELTGFAEMQPGTFAIEGDPTNTQLALEQTYKVKWDGAEYTCIVGKISTGPNTFAPKIGNSSIIDDRSSDTGEPFFFSSGVGGIWVTKQFGVSHTIQITKISGEIEKIPEKYYNPAAIVEIQHETIQVDRGEPFVSTKTPNEISDLIAKKIPVSVYAKNIIPGGDAIYSKLIMLNPMTFIRFELSGIAIEEGSVTKRLTYLEYFFDNLEGTTGTAYRTERII